MSNETISMIKRNIKFLEEDIINCQNNMKKYEVLLEKRMRSLKKEKDLLEHWENLMR
jgi:hypothetical protein